MVNITSIDLKINGCIQNISGDLFVLAAGGLGSPRILINSKRSLPEIDFDLIGSNYEDHPTGVIGKIKIDKRKRQFWKPFITKRYSGGFVRYRYTAVVNNQEFSFQLRPEYERKKKAINILSELRNNPFSFNAHKNFWSDIEALFELLNYKLGVFIPTSRYSVLLVSSMTRNSSSRIHCEENSMINREIHLDEEYKQYLDRAINIFKNYINKFGDFLLVDDLYNCLGSSCHHSGTVPMGESPAHSIVDLNCLFWGTSNLYVCDGSVIPNSGSSNTGLTIAALAIRLNDYLKASLGGGIGN